MTTEDLFSMIEAVLNKAKLVNRLVMELRLGPDAMPLMQALLNQHCTVTAKGGHCSPGAEYCGVPIIPMRCPGVALVTLPAIPVFKITKAKAKPH